MLKSYVYEQNFLIKLLEKIEKKEQNLDNADWSTESTKSKLLHRKNIIENYLQILSKNAEETDVELQTLIQEENKKLNEEMQRFFYSILKEDANTKGFIMVIKPGAGGVDSQDWAEMLLNMYTKYFFSKKIKFEITDHQYGDIKGIKSATIKVYENFQFFMGELGIHRLVRISPFNSQKKRHTSFAAVHIYKIVDAKAINIKDEDLKIDTFKASGAGGQHVNTTDSAVRIKHIPTGLVVSCQNERSQHQNKSSAIEILTTQLYNLYEERSREECKVAEKQSIQWSNHFRSYVLDPYKMIKDTKLDIEIKSNVDVLNKINGDIDLFITTYEKKYLKTLILEQIDK